MWKKVLFFAALFSVLGLYCQNNRVWGTYYGNTGNEAAVCVATDPFGNIYMAGYTTSTAGIASGGHQNAYGGGLSDAYLVKFDPNGTRIWATYYGGSNDDYGFGVTVDVNGDVYLVGATKSSTGIASGGFQNSASGSTNGFLVKFNSNGVRQWGTYYGGNNDTYFQGVICDATGNVYCNGYTSSTTSISTVGAHKTVFSGGIDCILIKFSTSGTRLWGTYYGGTSNEQCGNGGVGVAVDQSGNVFLSGQTQSSSGIASVGAFQTTHGGGTYDGFLAKFNSSGVRQWGTYYGGAGSDNGYDVGTDSYGNVYHCGLAAGTSTNLALGGFQNTEAGGWDAYLVKFDPSGNRIWATYYGDTGGDYGYDLEVDNQDNVFMAGATSGPSTLSYMGYQNTNGGTFIVKFDSNCNRLCCTYYDGQSNPTNIMPDNMGNLYFVGRTVSTPNIASGGFQNSFGGGIDDGFLVRFDNYCPSPSQPVSIIGASSLCSGVTVYSVAATPGVTSYSWSLPGGWIGTSSTNTISVTAASSGSILVSTINGCGSSIPQALSVTVYSLPIITVNSGSMCSGSVFTMSPSGANTYTYSSGSATVSPATNTSYSVSGTNSQGCISSSVAVAIVTVNPLPFVSVNSGSICSGGSFTMLPSGASTYTYSSMTSVVSPTITTSYSVTGTSAQGCLSSNNAVANITVYALPSVSVNSGSICNGGSFTMVPSGASTYTFSNGNSVVSPTTTMSFSVSGTSLQGCLSSNTAIATIVVNSLPTITITSTNSLLCAGQSCTLTASGASTYTWNTGGVGSGIITTPSITTSYTVTGTDNYGCLNTSIMTQSVSTCTGIDQRINKKTELLVYPNPFTDKITILTNDTNNIITVCNTLGSSLIEMKANQTLNEIDLSILPSGIYFVRIGSTIKKIIKENR